MASSRLRLHLGSRLKTVHVAERIARYCKVPRGTYHRPKTPSENWARNVPPSSWLVRLTNAVRFHHGETGHCKFIRHLAFDCGFACAATRLGQNSLLRPTFSLPTHLFNPTLLCFHRLALSSPESPCLSSASNSRPPLHSGPPPRVFALVSRAAAAY
jgi:hypothetical protein